MCSELSKQEYLKRYIEGDDKGKKRKRKPKTCKSILPTVKIVHEDVDIRSIKFGSKEETDEEECPVIAEVVDERPIEIKSKEIYESSRWKRLGEEETESSLGTTNSPHKKRKEFKPSSKSKKSVPNSRGRHDSDSDLSPARPKPQNSAHTNSDSDLSPVRPNRHKSLQDNSRRDLSPERSRKKLKSSHVKSDSDLSPERLSKRKSSTFKDDDSDLSPERKFRRRKSPSFKDDDDSDLSPPRKSTLSASRETKSKDKEIRPMKTLSGLKAGLQNAVTLREETKEFKKRERSRIEELDDELSGRNAGTVVRDKRTGQKRNLEDESKVDDEKKKELAEQQKKYDKWGKGLIQGESKNQKLAEDLYETSKPLARYCDDEDLEEKLKSEIRDDDPMAQYMRKKKQKHAVNVYPVYSGPPPPPNRFGITPGYRWDGVDRSNGFEKRYFEQKSSKKATEEEAYLWSVQDM
ncbi:BUD13 homolog [Parasteatoda tepidariorum]|uniref:BUD13 homolog n=1 Tax=Parasteatoda tepidariorum TaxID=114398 RepID=UPI001C71C65F|nr:BUD13 homolog [Parasteatoda tepidariorum]